MYSCSTVSILCTHCWWLLVSQLTRWQAVLWKQRIVCINYSIHTPSIHICFNLQLIFESITEAHIRTQWVDYKLSNLSIRTCNKTCSYFRLVIPCKWNKSRWLLLLFFISSFLKQKYSWVLTQDRVMWAHISSFTIRVPPPFQVSSATGDIVPAKTKF